MFRLDLFKRKPIEPVYRSSETLPSVTLAINAIENLRERVLVYEHFKIKKATIDFTNHSGPVDYLKNNIKLYLDQPWDNDYYLETVHHIRTGQHAVEEKDETTGKTRKTRKTVFIHTFEFDYFVMALPLGTSLQGIPFEQNGHEKEKFPLIAAMLTLYTLR